LSKKSSTDYHSLLLTLKMILDLNYAWDLKAAEKDLEIVLQTSNLSFRAYGAATGIARYLGKFQTALKLLKKYLEINPNPGGYVAQAMCEYLLGNYDKAKEILKMNDPISNDSFFYIMESSKVYYYLQAYNKSKIQLEKFEVKFSERPAMVLWLAAVHAEIEGNQIGVKESLRELEISFQQKTSGSPAWFVALYYCHIKDYDKAFEWLEKSYDHHEVEMLWLKEEPLLRPLRTDPRYIDLYDKVGFSKISPITPYVE